MPSIRSAFEHAQKCNYSMDTSLNLKSVQGSRAFSPGEGGQWEKQPDFLGAVIDNDSQAWRGHYR
jgi:hypothetical protein